jgi:AraC family transcriptional regulator
MPEARPTIGLVPDVINSETLPSGRIELVEWQWPELFDFSRSETELMLEMSLPPLSADASAYYADASPEQRCFMGTLFVRYPGLRLCGRAEAGRIRVLRYVFAPHVAATILAACPDPSVEFLHSLLNIRSDTLRSLMRLSHRELASQVERSAPALEALAALVAIELTRIFERQQDGRSGGRLAPWQYRRIRERLDAHCEPPTVAELAQLCGISSRHLHRQFLALTGKTVSAYIDARRIERAKELLAGRDASIKHVAAVCGFTHGASFSRAFRRTTGLTPQGYRQRTRMAREQNQTKGQAHV